MSASKPGASRPLLFGPTQDVSRVDGAGRQCLGGRKPELRTGERADERQALAERAPWVEVRGERDGSARFHERAGGRHRATEEERARGQQHAHHVARRQCVNAVASGCLQVVDRPRAELDRERDRTRFRELVAVQPQLEPVVARGVEVAASLDRVECTTLEEDIRRLGDGRGLGQDVRDQPVDVLVGVCSNSGGTACAPRNVGMPPAAAMARRDASSVSRFSP